MIKPTSPTRPNSGIWSGGPPAGRPGSATPLAIVLLTAFAIAPTVARAQDRSIGGVLDTLDRVRAFHATAVSPDGQRIAWVVDQPEGGTAIFWHSFQGGP